MNEMTVKAFAKINIGLDVTGRREDGYHLVRMIMQTVNIYDTLILRRRQDGKITMRTNAGFLPTDDSNLCVRAARLLQEEFHLTDGVAIELDKRIPVAAGMAGGSSDAAAVLRAMNELFSLGLTRQQLMDRGVRIGADVPYCLMGGTALAEGIGEVLTPLETMMSCPVLIAKPPISVSTAYVYEHLDAIADPHHPDIDAMMADLRAQDLHALGSHMGNILEEVTIAKYPVIGEIKELMRGEGAVVSMMSGSGPTVFGFFEDEASLQRAKGAVEVSGLASHVEHTTIYNTIDK